MSRTILIYGQSGSGKTTACRNLDPASTFIIDSDGKGLSWRGWRKQYNRQNQNYLRTDELDAQSKKAVGNVLHAVATGEQYKHVKTIVIDGLTTLMTVDVMRRAGEKGFDKWRDLAYSILNILRAANYYREDLTVVFIGHVDTDDESAKPIAHLKTSGRKLGQIVPESLFTTVLYAKSDGFEHWFETTGSDSTAKAPIDALPDKVGNDLAEVIKLLDEYEEG